MIRSIVMSSALSLAIRRKQSASESLVINFYNIQPAVSIQYGRHCIAVSGCLDTAVV